MPVITGSRNPYAAAPSDDPQSVIINGTSAGENISGLSSNDEIYGLGGNDTLQGLGGDDLLDGGEGNDGLYGGAGNDDLRGGLGSDSLYAWGMGETYSATQLPTTPTSDQLNGGEGNDRLFGLFGNTLDGGDGNDEVTVYATTNPGVSATVITGGSGSDRLNYYGSGTVNLGAGTIARGDAAVSFSGFEVYHFLGEDVTVYGTSGVDQFTTRGTAYGGGGDDVLTGYRNDSNGVKYGTLYGEGGNDTLNGDTLYGGDGDDQLNGVLAYGGDGNDTIFGREAFGEAGDDRIWFGVGVSIADGGDGIDTIIAPAADQVTIDLHAGTAYVLYLGLSNPISQRGALISIENIDARQSDRVTLTGSDGVNVIWMPTNAYEVTLDARGGDDVIYAGDRSQGINGGDGFDTVHFAFARDQYVVFEREDGGTQVNRSFSENPLFNVERLVFTDGSMLIQTGPMTSVVGTDGNDVLMGTEGSNFLRGFDGDDVLEGGAGADDLDGGAGNDTLSYSTSSAGVTVSLATWISSGGDAEGDAFANIENLTGSAHDDVLIGDAGVNVLTGGDGNDVLAGGGGSDALNGGGGFDIAAYAGARGGYATATSSTVTGGVEGGTDTLTGVEALAFVDGQLNFHRDGMAAQVMRLYDSAFNRIPDESGFEAQLDAMEDGMTLDALAQLFVDSQEFQNNYGALSDQQFVEQLYRNVLDREGEAAGVQNALSQLATQPGGTLTRGQLLVAFSESTEHKDLTQGTLDAGLWIADEQTLIIARLYDAAWNRLPDEGGLVTWRNALGGGAPLSQIATAFADSAEFTNTYGDLTDRQFVEQLYLNVLDRPGDEAGIQNALTYLEGQGGGAVGRGQLMLAFSESAEHVAITRPLWLGGVPLYEEPQPAALDAGKDAGPLVIPADADAFVPLSKHEDAQVLPGADHDLAFALVADQPLVLLGHEAIDTSALYVDVFLHDLAGDAGVNLVRNEGWLH